jgi:hypothetical protein
VDLIWDETVLGYLGGPRLFCTVEGILLYFVCVSQSEGFWTLSMLVRVMSLSREHRQVHCLHAFIDAVLWSTSSHQLGHQSQSVLVIVHTNS